MNKIEIKVTIPARQGIFDIDFELFGNTLLLVKSITKPKEREKLIHSKLFNFKQAPNQYFTSVNTELCEVFGFQNISDFCTFKKYLRKFNIRYKTRFGIQR